MAASPDEAAAMKRNLVHQTRLKLALKQLERDRNVRLREMNKDEQVFLHRLGERQRTSLPSLTELRLLPREGRITSAPTRRDVKRNELTSRPRTSHQFSKQLNASKLTSPCTTTTCPTAASLSITARHNPSRDNWTPHTRTEARDSSQLQDKQKSGFKEVRFQTPLESLQENKLFKQENPRIRQVTSPIRLEKGRADITHRSPRPRRPTQLSKW